MMLIICTYGLFADVTEIQRVPSLNAQLLSLAAFSSSNMAALGYLGMHCVPEDSSLKEAKQRNGGLFVEVGDEIEVLERGDHYFGATANDY